MWLSSGQGFVGSGPWDAATGILAVLCARDVACGQLLVAFWGLHFADCWSVCAVMQREQRRRVRLGDGKAEEDVGEEKKR